MGKYQMPAPPCGRACNRTDVIIGWQNLFDFVLGISSVYVHNDDARNCAGGYANVCRWPLGPPIRNHLRVRGSILESILSQWVLALVLAFSSVATAFPIDRPVNREDIPAALGVPNGTIKKRVSHRVRLHGNGRLLLPCWDRMTEKPCHDK